MANNIQQWFGVTVAVNTDIPKAKYVALRNLLSSATTKAGLDPKSVHIYIQHITIRETPTVNYHKVPLSDKLAHMTVKLEPMADARKQRRIKFLNHQFGPSYQNDVTIDSRDYIMQYSLPGNYCQQHGEFDDYVAILTNNCPERLRRLNMSITAHATPAFRANWRNDKTGCANTKIIFQLCQDIQLTF